MQYSINFTAFNFYSRTLKFKIPYIYCKNNLTNPYIFLNLLYFKKLSNLVSAYFFKVYLLLFFFLFYNKSTNTI